MKKYFIGLLVITLLSMGFAGLENTGLQDPTLLEKVANANGFENWRNVKELKFTFNVDRDTVHFERTWIWKPKNNDIVAIGAEDTLSYNWSNMDSLAFKTNAGFINDKFWLLVPFQLIWDSDHMTYEHTTDVEAPISKRPMQKLTITYGAEGGYTPGDAYDLYLDEDHIIREWIFRKGNAPTPSRITTFEDYREVEGLKLAMMHKSADNTFTLYFTNVEVRSTIN